MERMDVIWNHFLSIKGGGHVVGSNLRTCTTPASTFSAAPTRASLQVTIILRY